MLNESGYSLLSIVTPILNAAVGRPIVYAKLERMMASQEQPWEWVVVDDHSSTAVTRVADPNGSPEKPLLEETSRAIYEEG